MNFKISHTDVGSNARVATLTTSHGKIETPVFMPVGTAGTVKGVHFSELDQLGAKIILGNTYHLFLRPGLDVIKRAGGLHKFNGWNGPILTDSGGYQVFSLSANRKLFEEGAHFKSHIDGSMHLFTPENVVETQRVIGADIMMAFDECTPYPCDYKYAKDSMELTHRWLKRGYEHFLATEPLYAYQQKYFPIVQGSVYSDLRKQSAEYISEIGAEGNAIGGLSVGEPAEEMYQMISDVTAILPKEKPRYLMGVGTPENILEAIAMGVDMFDCVMPTRNGRNGMLFTWEGTINIRNKKWADDFSPIDCNGSAHVDLSYTKAFLRHLIISGELLGSQIASIHNLGFYMRLMQKAREKIIEGCFSDWKSQVLKSIGQRI